MTQEPRALHCEPLKEGEKTAEGQMQAGRSRVPMRVPPRPWEAAQGGATEPPQTVGRGGTVAYMQERSEPQSPLHEGEGG